ncbi:hypothetical protein [Aquimarina sp. 2201CG5-10]|uniref:hypothetical protein n=1 Tax=Aquimarina callyspongiae TaxID=3098150 RepID=UPI002AB392EC|nr:hypothetical protein [Aquimarina sp. 2201CG5-10]MDY8138619.1 hypothetical protein [Aquimarina sp. 2201CG5-10]
MMRKILIGCITLIVTLLISSCTNDDTNDIDELKSENGINKMGPGLAGEDDGICTVLFDFSSPGLTPSQKSVIRAFYNSNHFQIFSYQTVDSDTERWQVDCQSYSAYLHSLGLELDDTSCNGDGCIVLECEKASCENSGPGSNPDPVDPLESPFD